MIPLSHLPTLLLLVGYPVYWIELYLFAHPTGHTTLLAPVLFILLAGGFLLRQAPGLRGHFKVFEDKPTFFLFMIAAFLASIILVVAGMASLLPPHLCQEFDAINYHITIPRQHLLVDSFAHLKWSMAGLLTLPVDFALAPYWLVTELPNKFPQFMFFLALPFTAGSLAKKLGADQVKSWMVVFLILGTHGIAIQGGTAMLDVALCYLFIAALNSLLAGRWMLAAAELAFFIFSKPAIPLLVTALALLLVVSFFLGKKAGGIKTWSWGFGEGLLFPRLQKKFWIMLLGSSLLIGGPFMAKSVIYAGTPFYPLGTDLIRIDALRADPLRVEINQRGREHLAVKDSYGASRGLKDFLEHFWIIAVPEKGVNNRFDYPLGLPLLLVFVPFLFFLGRSLRRGNFPVLAVLSVAYWLLWWFGSQQSRFLFIPMVLMIITVVAVLPRVTRVLWGCVIAALVLTALSVYRAHASDLGRPVSSLLREYDRALLLKASWVKPGEVVEVEMPDAAFAPFIIDVKKEYGFYVLTP